MIQRTRTLPELLRLHLVEALMLVIAVFLAWRIVLPQDIGRATADRERFALAALTAIHSAERDAFAAGGAFLGLPALVKSSDDPTLRGFERVEPEHAKDVDLYRAGGYLFVVYVDDPEKDNGRVYGAVPPDASDRVGHAEYGAFAWPERLSDTTQWAFFVQHRGKLLGTANTRGEFAGQQEPFPPTANPLRDFVSSMRDDSDSAWVRFSDLGEVIAR